MITMPDWVWAEIIGWLCGLGTFWLAARWRQKPVYCPRCLHYMNWREQLREEVLGPAAPPAEEPW
jgi:hypothetical protein